MQGDAAGHEESMACLDKYFEQTYEMLDSLVSGSHTSLASPTPCCICNLQHAVQPVLCSIAALPRLILMIAFLQSLRV